MDLKTYNNHHPFKIWMFNLLSTHEVYNFWHLSTEHMQNSLCDIIQNVVPPLNRWNTADTAFNTNQSINQSTLSWILKYWHFCNFAVFSNAPIKYKTYKIRNNILIECYVDTKSKRLYSLIDLHISILSERCCPRILTACVCINASFSISQNTEDRTVKENSFQTNNVWPCEEYLQSFSRKRVSTQNNKIESWINVIVDNLFSWQLLRNTAIVFQNSADYFNGWWTTKSQWLIGVMHVGFLKFIMVSTEIYIRLYMLCRGMKYTWRNDEKAK